MCNYTTVHVHTKVLLQASLGSNSQMNTSLAENVVISNLYYVTLTMYIYMCMYIQCTCTVTCTSTDHGWLVFHVWVILLYIAVYVDDCTLVCNTLFLITNDILSEASYEPMEHATCTRCTMQQHTGSIG